MNYQIRYEPEPSKDDIQVLANGIRDYAKLKKNQPPIETFGFFVRDPHEKVIGGCNGVIYYGCFYIDFLWLDESIRGKKLGTQLIQSAEKLANDKKCLFITVNTMDWEALDFYKKLGYQVEHQRTGYANNSTLYFLRKDLTASR